MNSKISLLFRLLAVALAIPISASNHEEDSDGQTADGEEPIQLELEVEATVIQEKAGKTTYSEEQIESTPVGERNLGDLLRINPAVDFSRQSDRSSNGAVLRPPEFSIHGQEFYQNLFIIDGTDVTSDINPADSEDMFSTPSLVAPHRGSSPQGYYLDLDLVGDVVVYDSNIPVEFGGFLGGVVDVSLADLDGTSRIDAHYGTQRDEWEKIHVNVDEDLVAADWYRARYTPNYQKDNVGVSLRHELNGVGPFMIGLTRRTSVFDQQYEDDADVLRMIEYEDSIQNLIGLIDLEVGQTSIGLSGRYTDRTNDGVTSPNYTGRFEKSHRGWGGTANVAREFDRGELEVNIGIDQLEDILDSEFSNFVYHEYLEGSGMSRFEGAYGDTNQNQTRMVVSPKWSFSTESVGEFDHKIAIGGSLRRTDTFYERPEDIKFERYDCIRDMGRQGCVDQDGDGVSSAGDERLGSESFWYKGKVDTQYGELAAYVEDQIEYKNWNFYLGLRVDRNGYLENVDVSPRTSATWNIGETGRDAVTLGLNRYHGRSFLRYEINDQIYSWREIYLNLTRPRGRAGEEVPCSNPRFVNCTHRLFENRSKGSELDTPYSDEVSLSWMRSTNWIQYTLAFVNRETRNGVMRQRDDDGLYFYTNDGESSSQTYTLTGTALLGRGSFAETSVYFGLNYNERTSNRQDDTGYEEQLDMDLIYYEGGLIGYDELPPFDYNIPLGIRLSTKTEIPALKLSWSNFLNIKRGGVVARDTRENYESPETGIEYDIFEDFEFDGLTTVDSRFVFRLNPADRPSGYIQIEVHNLFDDFIDYNTVSTRRQNSAGRRFWIEIGTSIPLG